MVLDMIPCESGSDSDDVVVRFYIKIGAGHRALQRPFQLAVDVAIRNKGNPRACRSVSRRWKNVSDAPLLQYFWIVQSFPFKYADLVRDRVAVGRSPVAIECSVGIDYEE